MPNRVCGCLVVTKRTIAKALRPAGYRWRSLAYLSAWRQFRAGIQTVAPPARGLSRITLFLFRSR